MKEVRIRSETSRVLILITRLNNGEFVALLSHVLLRSLDPQVRTNSFRSAGVDGNSLGPGGPSYGSK